MDTGRAPQYPRGVRVHRKKFLAWLGLGALGMAGETRAGTSGKWLPNRALIDEIEAKIVMPPGASPLGSYARSYTGVTEGGRAKVRGYFVSYGFPFVPRSTPPVSIVEDLVPMVQDGGCDVITLDYDVQSKEIHLVCNGEA